MVGYVRPTLTCGTSTGNITTRPASRCRRPTGTKTSRSDLMATPAPAQTLVPVDALLEYLNRSKPRPSRDQPGNALFGGGEGDFGAVLRQGVHDHHRSALF